MGIDLRFGIRGIAALAAAVAIVLAGVYMRIDLVWLPVAFASAALLAPVADWLAARSPTGGRPLAIAAIATVSVLVAGLVTLALPLARASMALARISWDRVQATGDLTQLLRPTADSPWILFGNDPVLAYTDLTGPTNSGATSAVATVTVGFALALVVLVLVEGPQWAQSFWRGVDPRVRSTMQPCAQRIRKCAICSMWASLTVATIAGLMLSLALVLLERPHLVPLGIIAGYFSLTPVIAAGLMVGVATLTVLFVSIQAALGHELVTEIRRLGHRDPKSQPDPPGFDPAALEADS